MLPGSSIPMSWDGWAARSTNTRPNGPRPSLRSDCWRSPDAAEARCSNLRWCDIGNEAIRLADSKTGPRAVPLGEAARVHIESLPGKRGADAFLFPRYAEGRGQDSLRRCWRVFCADAKLGKLRLHDLRHTAASHAVMSGENLPLVGKLLGHRRHRTTAGYAHLADEHLVEAAEKVGSLIAEAMDRSVQAPLHFSRSFACLSESPSRPSTTAALLNQRGP